MIKEVKFLETRIDETEFIRTGARSGYSKPTKTTDIYLVSGECNFCKDEISREEEDIKCEGEYTLSIPEVTKVGNRMICNECAEKRRNMFNLKDNLLEVNLPEGHSGKDLIELTKIAIDGLIAKNKLNGLDLKINGRITTAMSLLLGHKLSHICKSVSIFDPKENTYLLAIWH